MESLVVSTAVCEEEKLPDSPGMVNEDTCIYVTGLEKAAFDEAQFLFLLPAFKVVSGTDGDILLGGAFRGCIYVRDMRVLTGAENHLGLNLKTIKVKRRDRIGHLDHRDMLKHIFNVLNAAAQSNQQLAELLLSL